MTMHYHTEIIRPDGTVFTDGTSTNLEYELRRRNEIWASNRNNGQYEARVVDDDHRICLELDIGRPTPAPRRRRRKR